ncbi:hypothetical protein P5673_014052 [Acropora cervicornis]|uniref:Uncharacterized protein n=1 Tax=Acropora cervicornis TaxID=6130 RepID=A0AAD9V6P3_ACRCE|nr:hypothetical protein P5673_014052 [Acropora cervicornis]
MFYGERVSKVNQQEFIDQICPKAGTNERKYVRLRTFNDKYIFAYATDSGDNSYLRTRCCGAKDAVGRSDVKVPGRRTTFLIHCQRIGNENTFKFEILNEKNNNPSGYYFYADLKWAQYGIWAKEYTDDPDPNYFEFVLHRWCGPVIAIRTYRPGPDPSNWVTFGERRNSDGRVTAFRNLVSDKKNSLPNFADTYTLEAVPSGCVDALVNVMSSGRRWQVRNRKNAKVNQTDVIGQMAGMSVADVGYQGHVTTIKT